MEHLKGKRILVTGAGKGIGREICVQLAKHGAAVTALSRTQADLDSLKKEVPCDTVLCDLEDEKQIQECLGHAEPFDGLVNNAGVTALSPFLDMPITDFDRVMSVNCRSVFIVSQLVARAMVKHNRPGAIVNVSSVASTRAFKDHTSYCASKGALDQLTRMMALELGPHRIKVNSVNPTVVLTDMGRKAWGDQAKAAPVLNRIAMQQFAEPAHVAQTVLFLLSPMSDMIQGAMLPIDGGFLIS